MLGIWRFGFLLTCCEVSLSWAEVWNQSVQVRGASLFCWLQSGLFWMKRRWPHCLQTGWPARAAFALKYTAVLSHLKVLVLLCSLSSGGKITVYCFTPATYAWKIPHCFSVLFLWGGFKQCALEMRDFPWAAGGTRLENAGTAGGERPVQNQRGAKRKKASRQPALREASGRTCFDAASGSALPRGTWREPICVRVRLWAQDFCQCIPVTPKWGTPHQATHRGKEKSLYSPALDWCMMLSLPCSRIMQGLVHVTCWSSFVLPWDLLSTWALAAQCWWAGLRMSLGL